MTTVGEFPANSLLSFIIIHKIITNLVEVLYPSTSLSVHTVVFSNWTLCGRRIMASILVNALIPIPPLLCKVILQMWLKLGTLRWRILLNYVGRANVLTWVHKDGDSFPLWWPRKIQELALRTEKGAEEPGKPRWPLQAGKGKQMCSSPKKLFRKEHNLVQCMWF